ncbi:MAG TPA: helix-turn-helix domain-containing protein, partial [Fluviicoccus sp.]|nr:helix-turn-helix domain-containing protein [Fluviicoccus sp.]
MRRKPQQLRSREMVDKLIDATGKVIVARGLDYATTNHIAEEAGVNIASLYHYFGNKEEMIEALQDRMTQDLLQTL